MESTVYCVKSAEKCQKKCRKQQKTREIADFSENRGFGPKSRNLLRPWNRDFLEGQNNSTSPIIEHLGAAFKK